MNDNQTIKTSVARMISIIGHPMLTAPLFVLIVLFTGNDLKSASFLTLLIIGGVFIPIVTWMFLKSKNGSYTNFDVSDQKQRRSLFRFAIPIMVVVTTVLFITHQSRNTCLSLLFATILVVVSQVVNYFFIKSSLHVSLTLYLAFLSLAIAPILGYALMVLSILIGWSRVELKRHTISEVVVGAVIGVGIGGALFYFLTLQ